MFCCTWQQLVIITNFLENPNYLLLLQPTTEVVTLTGCNTAYVQLITNMVIPNNYICGRNFQGVKDCLESKNTNHRPKRMQICVIGKRLLKISVETIRQFELFPVQEYLQSLDDSNFSEKCFKNVTVFFSSVWLYIKP